MPTAHATCSQERLQELGLPHELDAVTHADRSLPPATRQKVLAAKALGTASKLNELRVQCEASQKEALELATLASNVLDEEGKRDEELLKELPTANLASMRSTYNLQMVRSSVTDASERLNKSVTVTSDLCARFDASLDKLAAITPSIEEIEHSMPHLDGTPLDQEPCVLALRSLIEQLEQIKVPRMHISEPSPSPLRALSELSLSHLRAISEPSPSHGWPSAVPPCSHATPCIVRHASRVLP